MNKRATRRGVRNLVKLIAIAYNGHWRKEPVWMRIYLTNVWARKEIREKLHYNVRVGWTMADRRQARELVSGKKRRLRTTHRNFYMWLHREGV